MKIFTSYADDEKYGYIIVQSAIESEEFEKLRTLCKEINEVHDEVIRQAINYLYDSMRD